ncbi:MAG: CoA transferase subunit A [Candidatus Aminicenantes bacterium]|nr:MAG: CoA transferase subunit A [Candidatus Aminicenantes bacterium]
MEDKLMTMAEAVKKYVKNGDILDIEGFTHLICFAAGHEIIRQRKKDLIACRLTPDLIYDQMIAAGCVRKVVFSWAGNPGVGPLYGLRRAVEKGIPRNIEIEEYTHFGMVARFMAGASNLPFMHLRSFYGSTLFQKNKKIKSVKCPYTGQMFATVPALNPDVAIIQVQRVASLGNAHSWGLMGVQKEAAFASKKVIIVAEELVDSGVIRSDPNRTLIPGMIVNAVVIEPFAAHPSYALGYYNRDNQFYVDWYKISKDQASMERYISNWIFAVSNRVEYVEKLGANNVKKLKARKRLSAPVNYGY